MNKIKRPSLVLNSISNWCVLGINVAIGLFLTPLIIQSIGKTGYGIWTLVWSIVGYYGVFDFGVTAAVERFAARSIGKNDQNSLVLTINSAFFILAITACVSIVISFFGASIFSIFFNIKPQNASDFITIVKLLGTSAAVIFMGAVAAAFLRANERFVGLNFAKAFGDAIRLVLSVIALHQGFGLKGLAFAVLVSTVLKVMIYYLIAFTSYPEFRFSIKNVDFSVIRELSVFGAFLWIAFISSLLRNHVDSVVIGKFLTIESVGVYGIGAIIIRYLSLFIKALTSVFTPRLSKLAGEENHAKFAENFLSFSNATGVFTFGLGLLAFLLGPDFIYFWVGDSFKEAKIVLLVLLIGQLADSSTGVTFGAVVAVNRHKFYAISAIAEGIANFLLSIILVKKFGLLGVALGTVIPLTITKLFFQTFYCCRVIRVSIFNYIYISIVKPLMAFVFTILIVQFGIGWKNVEIYDFVLHGFIILFLYFILTAVWGLTYENRNIVLNKFSSFVKRRELLRFFV